MGRRKEWGSTGGFCEPLIRNRTTGLRFHLNTGKNLFPSIYLEQDEHNKYLLNTCVLKASPGGRKTLEAVFPNTCGRNGRRDGRSDEGKRKEK